MICPICKKRIRGGDKIKRNGVWQHKHKPKYGKKWFDSRRLRKFICEHFKIVDTKAISPDITKHTIERI